MPLVSGSMSGMRLASFVAANNSGLAKLATKISSGRRVVSAADDAAGLGVATNLDTRVLSTRAAIRNAETGIALAQVADTAAGEVNSTLQRMRELAVQAASDTLKDGDRVAIQNEFGGLNSEVGRISSTVEFSGIRLGDGSVTSLLVQTGIRSTADSRMGITLSPLTNTALGLTGATFNVNTSDHARSSLDVIDGALFSVSRIRSMLGATVNRLEASIGASEGFGLSLANASSMVLDADYAKETAEFARKQILMVAGGASLLHHKRIERQALRLLA